MGLIREPKNVDFTQESKPWNESELSDFRELMRNMKSKNLQPKARISKIKKAGIVLK